jgi:hypothetical protein
MSHINSQPTPVTVFFSYSHKDERLRDKLATHLSNLQRQDVIKSWHDRKITAGTNWAKEIDDNLDARSVERKLKTEKKGQKRVFCPQEIQK